MTLLRQGNRHRQIKRNGIALNNLQATSIDTVTMLSDATGINFRFFQSELKDGKYTSKYTGDNGQSPNGFYKDGEIYVDINSGAQGQGLFLFTVSHELTHFMRDFAPEQFDKYAAYLFENYSKRGGSIRQAVYEEMNKHRNLKYDVAYEEVVARLSESFLRDTHLTEKSKELYNTDKTVWEKIRDGLQSIVERIERWMAGLSPESDLGKIGQKMAQENREILDRFIAGVRAAADNAAYTKNTTDEGGVRNQVREDFAQQLDDWRAGNGKKNGKYNGKYFDLGTTPDVLVKHGALSSKVIMYEDCILKVTGGKHAISLDEISKLPYELDDPVLLFKGSVKDSFVALTEIVDKNGHEVIAAVHINRRNNRNVIQKIASLYSKTDDYGRNKIVPYITNQINAGNLIDASKEKAPNWFTSRGLQLPKLVQTIIDANNSISDSSTKSNTSSKNNSTGMNQSRDADYLSAVNRGDMETAQRMVDEAAEKAFANSKIRGEDGKLVKVYHGTYADFTVFDKAMGCSSADIQGMFFSPWDIDAGGYGPNVRAFYLNITNPADERTGYKALNAHKGENYAGIKAREDLEKAGYDGVNNSDEEYIAFTSEQIKSADPVTYDDNGNVIPLSQRFDTSQQDIRFDERVEYDDWANMVWDDEAPFSMSDSFRQNENPVDFAGRILLYVINFSALSFQRIFDQ